MLFLLCLDLYLQKGAAFSLLSPRRPKNVMLLVLRLDLYLQKDAALSLSSLGNLKNIILKPSPRSLPPERRCILFVVSSRRPKKILCFLHAAACCLLVRRWIYTQLLWLNTWHIFLHKTCRLEKTGGKYEWGIAKEKGGGEKRGGGDFVKVSLLKSPRKSFMFLLTSENSKRKIWIGIVTQMSSWYPSTIFSQSTQ
jgi:hypothetical protein